MRKPKAVALLVPERKQITPTGTIQQLALTLALLEQMSPYERQVVLKNACFYFGFRLEHQLAEGRS